MAKAPEKTASANVGGNPGKARPVRTHADEAVATLMARDPDARERHYKRMRLATVLAGAAVVSVIFNTVSSTLPKDPLIIGSDSDGHLQRLITLDEPMKTAEFERGWVATSLVSAFTFGFATASGDLLKTKGNFTDGGWSSFITALGTSGVFDTVTKNKLDVQGVVNGAIVDSTGAQGPVSQSIYEVPMLVTYRSAGSSETQKFLVIVKVDRVPTYKNARGFAISSLVVR
jgi:hypothetical protein